MTPVPQIRLEVRRRRVRRFMLGCLFGITAGWGCYYALNEATRAPRPWIAEFPHDGDVQAWGQLDTQRLDVAKPDTVWQHHRRWFVVGREPRAKGRSLGPAEWFFIDGAGRRMVGPWRPGVKLSLHGFMPDGRYMGVNARQAGGTFRILKFDPATGHTEDRQFESRSVGQQEFQGRICASADCSTLAVLTAKKDEPLWVRFFDVTSGDVIAERTFDYFGYLSGRYYRRPGRNGGLPIYYSLSPDGSRFVIAQSSGFEVVRTSDAKTINETDDAFSLAGDQRGTPRRFFGIEFSSDGEAVVGARAAAAEATRKFKRTYRGRVPPTRVLRRVIFHDGAGKSDDSLFAIDWQGQPLPTRTRYVLDEHRTLTTDLDNESPSVLFAGHQEIESNVRLRLRSGFRVLEVNGMPDTQRLVVNTLHNREARDAHIPFMRSVLNALNLDPARPACMVEGIWQYQPGTRKWDLIRQLTRKSNRISPTRVAIQPGRIGLLMKRNGRYRFEVWFLPRFTVRWVRGVAAVAGGVVFLVTLFWRRRRTGR